jgi:hypothetical protein
MDTKNLPKNATFFISTGRCATQWMTDKLSTHYHDLAVVKHEPFQVEYEPRFYFNAYHRKEEVNLSHAIEEHLSFIHKTIQDFSYIETGWPIYGALPFILSHLKGRVKVVHLYRHPIRVAASLATKNVYSKGAWSDAVAISPSDYGVTQGYLEGHQWNSMSQFEKCLFWWTEINQFALDLHRNFESIPWLTLKYEEVFSENSKNELRKLINFLSLPERESFFNFLSQKTDNYSSKSQKPINIHAVEKYPKVFELMDKLEYEYEDSNISEIKRRYEMSFWQRWLRRSIRATGCEQWIRRSIRAIRKANVKND